MKEKIDSLLGKTLTVIMGLMVLNVLLQVFARFLRIQVDFTEEVAGFLLIWVGLLGASYATGKGMHLAIDLLPRSKSIEAQNGVNENRRSRYAAGKVNSRGKMERRVGEDSWRGRRVTSAGEE